ncbi:antibiotic biosynthesis monooxygenase [Nocardioides sp.]|uniref:antibiotic biosynthesis monooxygenase family protein n=1 Tax=Nocardioides sp. TaxID=35761 RepID=UPI0026385190|nr:antibiotic biosynthesis monooxygenase [Nocardioides sp.]MCW2737330.1 Antibiotic biosynthesis monooxygenase [Nocardioides sp.]
MLVVTRLRAQTSDGFSDEAAGEELRRGLLHALGILAAKPGYVGGEVGRNVDDPTLWALATRWENVGSYRRALGSYEGKMHIQPLMVHALDEPSAYEVVEEGTDLNEARGRRRPEEGDGGVRLEGSIR